MLHIVSGMNRGGIETWLMNVMRRLDRDAVRFEFLVETRDQADYDDEILALGGGIHRSPRYRRRARAAYALARLFASHGPYDVVHAHGRHDMGWPLSVARAAGVPVRIGHVHNIKDSHHEDPVRRAYKRLMKSVLQRQASWILGCSTAALESLYGPGAPAAHKRMEVLPYGIDMRAFTPRDTRAAVRRELGIPEDGLIAGHVGRFVWEKNHAFLLEVFAELLRRDDRWHLLLVGDGPLRANIERAIAARGLREHVHITGVRADVADLVSAMDVFVFPSLIEGFGLVAVEAQALGVPCVLGAHLPRELDVHAPSMHRVALDAGANQWAERVEHVRESLARPGVRTAHANLAHACVAASPFNIDRCVAVLLSRYYKFLQGDG